MASYSLLVGSLALLTVLSGVMFGTRRVSWSASRLSNEPMFHRINSSATAPTSAQIGAATIHKMREVSAARQPSEHQLDGLDFVGDRVKVAAGAIDLPQCEIVLICHAHVMAEDS
jgi:hypothetical protein